MERDHVGQLALLRPTHRRGPRRRGRAIPQLARAFFQWLAVAVVFAVVAYFEYAGVVWLSYGHTRPPQPADPMFDRVMPVYEVVERHRIRVAAPAEVTYAAACGMELEQSAIIRAIFAARAFFMRSEAVASSSRPAGFVAQMQAMGWGILAEEPRREIILGGVTQPWSPNPFFLALPADSFRAFREPGQVKIAYNLRVEPVGPGESIFHTETRVATTDAASRARFRRYWALVSPGVRLIRWASLGPLKADAERRARELGRGPDLPGPAGDGT
jgi:hypothetical protein